jgi:hypothetical protein
LLPLMDRRVPMLTSRTNSGWPVHTPAAARQPGRGASAARREAGACVKKRGASRGAAHPAARGC